MSSQRSDIKLIVILELCCKDLESKEGKKNVWWPVREWEEVRREGRKKKRDLVRQAETMNLLLISTCKLKFKRMIRKHLLRALLLKKKKKKQIIFWQIVTPSEYISHFGFPVVRSLDVIQEFIDRLFLSYYKVFVFWQTFCIHGMHFKEKSILLLHLKK